MVVTASVISDHSSSKLAEVEIYIYIYIYHNAPSFLFSVLLRINFVWLI